ncbi:MAG: hypothetical protein ACRC0G_05865 [Fusobacteriaceae bacterium]
MDKILEWLEKSIIYSFDNSDSIFENYFKALSLSGELMKPKSIRMEYDRCEVFFDSEFKVLIVDGESVNRPIIGKKEQTEPPVEEPKPEQDFEFDEDMVEDEWATVVYTKIGNGIYANNLIGEPIKIKAYKKVYFKEAYPDFADEEDFVEIEIPTGRNVIFEGVKNKITELTLDKTYVLEYKGTYYFTSIAALKEGIADTGLTLPNKKDDKLKLLILEKSLYLKKKFGLTEEQTEDHEMYPVFKRLTILYCLREIIAYTFIQGEITSNGGDGGVVPTSTNTLTLGKFSTKSGSGSSGGSGSSSGSSDSGFLPDIVANQIAIAEEDVRRSIFIKSDKVYWFKKQGGVSHG